MDNMKVLLVDDDKDFLGLLSRNIESWGYKVISSLSGKDALGMFRRMKADIVVLDYQMPGMDGIDTLKGLRGMDEKVPVIMFTSAPDKNSIEGAEKLGIFAYIPKAGVFTDAESSLKSAIEMACRIKRG